MDKTDEMVLLPKWLVEATVRKLKCLRLYKTAELLLSSVRIPEDCRIEREQEARG